MVFRRSTPIKQEIETETPSHVDGLTGLPDRWQVEVWISEHLSRSQRTGDRFGFFLVSVANLTEINAGYGSAVGDEVLQAVAESLTKAVGSTGLVARYLGSEFAIIRPGLFAIEEMSRIARTTMDTLPRQVSFESFVVPVRIAVAGLISNPDLSDWLLIVDAEQALAEAKSDPARPVVIRGEHQTSRRKPEVLAVRLQRAFDNNEFQLHYQPIVSLASGAVVGFESMLRWLSPDAGPLGAEIVGPSEFMVALRESPITVPLHAWILRECLTQVSGWSHQLQMPSLFAAANMDPTFILDDRFGDVVMSALNDTGVRPQQVLLDINANVAGAHINMLWPQLAKLKAQGVGIALEDYGVGLGSADLLRRCRFDVIRLPRSLVGGLGLADEDRLIVIGIVNLAHSLGYYVVAEGVETADQVRLLRSAKCDLIQGFIIGKPAQDTDITKNLDKIRRQAKDVSEL